MRGKAQRIARSASQCRPLANTYETSQLLFNYCSLQCLTAPPRAYTWQYDIPFRKVRAESEGGERS